MDFFGVGGGTLRRPSKAGISLSNIKKYSTFAIVKARKSHQKNIEKSYTKIRNCEKLCYIKQYVTVREARAIILDSNGL